MALRLVFAALLWAAPAGAMQLAAVALTSQAPAEECHTAVRGEECHHHVRWAMRKGIPNNPEWYPGLTVESSFEEVQGFLHRVKQFSKACTVPCKAEEPSAKAAAKATAEKSDKSSARGTETAKDKIWPFPKKEQCRTAVQDDACHYHVKWAMKMGIPKHPEWYPGLSRNSSFEDVQSFLHSKERYSKDCAMPCAPTAKKADAEECHTALREEECHYHVRWAMTDGLKKNPEWYPGLKYKASSFEEVQAFLHSLDKYSSVCRMPCSAQRATTQGVEMEKTAAAEAPAGECKTATWGDDCHFHVWWAKREGIKTHPDWYPGLTSESSFEDVQEFLHGLEKFTKKCPLPCRTQQAEAATTSEPAAAKAKTATHDDEDKAAATEDAETAEGAKVAAQDDAEEKASEEPYSAKEAAQEQQPLVEADDSNELFAPESPMNGQTPAQTEVTPQQADWSAVNAAPSPEAPPRPDSAGCFVWLPNGCRRHHFQAKSHWKRDEWGELHARSAADSAACAARKHSFDIYCGVVDAVMLHVAPSQEGTKAVESPHGVDTQAGPPGEREDMPPSTVQQESSALPEGAPPLPDGAGCFVWLPSGCKRKHFPAKNHWKRDEWGEAQLRSAESSATCAARKHAFDMWCGVVDAVMLHQGVGTHPASAVPPTEPMVPGPPAYQDPNTQYKFEYGSEEAASLQPLATATPVPPNAPPLPQEGGCFVWLPTGCRRKHFPAKEHWKRDEWGELNERSADSIAACEGRKHSFDMYCGVVDTVMRLVVPSGGATVSQVAAPMAGAPHQVYEH